jgi:hypothetical protein
MEYHTVDQRWHTRRDLILFSPVVIIFSGQVAARMLDHGWAAGAGCRWPVLFHFLVNLFPPIVAILHTLFTRDVK